MKIRTHEEAKKIRATLLTEELRVEELTPAFKVKMIFFAFTEKLLDKSFIEALNLAFYGRKQSTASEALAHRIGISPELDFIFIYTREKIQQAIKSDDLLILGPGHPRLKFTRKMHRYGREMMIVKQLNDSLDLVCTYISSGGYGRTEGRSRTKDLRRAYGLYLAFTGREKFINLHRVDEVRTRGLLFICVSLFILHEKIVEQIVEELIDLGAHNYRAMIPDPRVFLKVAIRGKRAKDGARLKFIETYMHKVLEYEKLPTI